MGARGLAAVCGLLVGLAGCAKPAPIAGARCDDAHVCGEGHYCQGARCAAFTTQTQACKVDDDCHPPFIHHCVASQGICGCEGPEHCGGGSCPLQGYPYQCGCVPGYCPNNQTQFCNMDTGLCEPIENVDGDASDAEGTTGGVDP